MRIQLVRTLQGGEKLAGPVITKENEILISEGTTLKTEYLDLISFLGIETVCIEDPYEEDETPHDIISNEKREEYIEKIKYPGEQSPLQGLILLQMKGSHLTGCNSLIALWKMDLCDICTKIPIDLSGPLGSSA